MSPITSALSRAGFGMGDAMINFDLNTVHEGDENNLSFETQTAALGAVANGVGHNAKLANVNGRPAGHGHGHA